MHENKSSTPIIYRTQLIRPLLYRVPGVRCSQTPEFTRGRCSPDLPPEGVAAPRISSTSGLGTRWATPGGRRLSRRSSLSPSLLLPSLRYPPSPVLPSLAPFPLQACPAPRFSRVYLLLYPPLVPPSLDTVLVPGPGAHLPTGPRSARPPPQAAAAQPGRSPPRQRPPLQRLARGGRAAACAQMSRTGLR